MKIEVNVSKAAGTVTVHIEAMPMEDMGSEYAGNQEYVDTHRVIDILSARDILVGRAIEETMVNNKRRNTSTGTWVFALPDEPLTPTQTKPAPQIATPVEKAPQGVTASSVTTDIPVKPSPIKKGKLPAKRKSRKRVK